MQLLSFCGSQRACPGMSMDHVSAYSKLNYSFCISDQLNDECLELILRAAINSTLNRTCAGPHIALFSLSLMEEIMAFSFIQRRNDSKPLCQLKYIGFLSLVG